MTKSILLAENNNSFRDILTQKLEGSGYATHIAQSGTEVVASALEKKPNLILLALDITERSGLEVMLDLKTRDETRRVPVIVISDSGDPMEVEKARELGADDFLIRAIIDPDEVLEKINKVCNAPIDPSNHSEENDESADELDTVLADVEIPQAEAAAKGASLQGGEATVMIVEDDKFLREDLYGRKLRSAGFDIESTDNGERALKMLTMMKPDIIILDLVLPGMDGFEILEQIRAGETTKDIPVIIVSNLGQQEDIDKAMKLGATDFMVKANFTLDEIVSRIRSTIAK